MADWPFDLDHIAIGESFELLVAWRPGRRDSGVGQINTAGDVETFLMGACANTLSVVRERHPRAYSPDMALEDDEVIVFDDDDVIRDSHIGKSFFQGVPGLIGSRDLPGRPLTMYAVVAGVGEDRVAYIRKANPLKTARGGKIFTSLANALTRIQNPVFTLDEEFDLIATMGGVVALHQPAFESLFRMLPEEAIPDWIERIASHLPIAENGAELLASDCITNSRLRRKLRSLIDATYLPKVTAEDIRKQLKELDLDEAYYMNDAGELVIREARGRNVIDVLNEDVIVGAFSNARYRIDRKSRDEED